MYREGVERFQKQKKYGLAASAALHWAREELNLDGEVIGEVRDLVKSVRKSGAIAKNPELLLLADRLESKSRPEPFGVMRGQRLSDQQSQSLEHCERLLEWTPSPQDIMARSPKKGRVLAAAV